MKLAKTLTAAVILSTQAHIFAQTGASYSITQSVVAGGGASSISAAYAVMGTVGQPAAGTNSVGGGFAVRSGFWQFEIPPSAALVSISGSVMGLDGQPLRSVRLSLAGSGGVPRIALTNAFGYFRFDDVEVGNAYVVTASHKRYEFAPRVVMVTDEISELIITAIAAN